MEEHFLYRMFNPGSIAVIGASDKPLSVGAKVFTNLLADFSGPIFPVNPKYKTVQGNPCFPSIKEINHPVDLAVIVTPAAVVPQIMIECGEKNVRHAIILSAGFGEANAEGKELEQTVIDLAKQFKIRFVGPNCLGGRRPSIGLNATFENSPVLSGNLAFISQSGALCAAILDWAFEEQVGFSTVVSLGNCADIGFGELLDYLALDQKTDCILLYIEGIKNARKFMSGLRAASRLKPVIAIKAGRHSQGARAAISHTGAMIGADDVFDAALRRAGVVRVNSIKELFSAAEVFSNSCRAKGNQLTIITNGGGAGVMAADRAADLNIPLSELTDETISYLDSILPSHWSHRNPIDILGDATPERYQQVIKACLKDENCDGLLIILVPVAMSEPLRVAEQVSEIIRQSEKPILTCWMGKTQVGEANNLFAKHKIPSFNTPEVAVDAFSYLANYYHNQQLLLQVPEPLSYQSQPDISGAQLIIESAVAEHRKILTATESKAILRAFGIPITQTILAHTATEALVAAESLGFPVVMKIHSPDITHKQDVSGVQLNITNAEAVRTFFYQLIERAQKKMPTARIIGVTVEPMYKTSNDRELMVGIIKDPVFGPTINFGAGGSLIEIMQDRAIALPPLNNYLIKNLIARTRIAKLLGEFRNKPAVNITAIEELLLRVSEMVCELPQIEEMDINPLIVNDKEVVAVDARIVINFETSFIPYSHLAIHPYPSHLISHWQLADGTSVLIRPIRPEDAKLEQNFIRHLSSEAKYFRFMGALRELTPEMLKRTAQIDYDREMAMVAVIQNKGRESIIGIAYYYVYPDLTSCEFALVTADKWQNKGIGSHLMTSLMSVAKTKNLKNMEGIIMSANQPMLALAKSLGFSIKPAKEDPALLLAGKVLF
ncbi:bifunctional acetate--CoA ligase family protein/GNAT family N-acetyltransferase [Legionella feeleii]|uniref:Acetyltransferase Pat n=1 Tax=Legionella feeleii TaxID=453 RepID=A0A0W0TVK8_9GAMM|nr:bifunctional acetate--CoA ligase family protein/GNAT family N-acetyltransferase [Legionella feeleii]KTC99761.1 Acetyltransferase Pat [Legionella feeleii]SPX60482.1 succinyl-CoA synthetase subunit alpha [Legionella feeleii]